MDNVLKFRPRTCLETIIIVWLGIHAFDLAQYYFITVAYAMGPTMVWDAVLSRLFVFPPYFISLVVGPIWYFRTAESGVVLDWFAGLVCVIGVNGFYLVEQMVGGRSLGLVGDVTSYAFLLALFPAYGYMYRHTGHTDSG